MIRSDLETGLSQIRKQNYDDSYNLQALRVGHDKLLFTVTTFSIPVSKRSYFRFLVPVGVQIQFTCLTSCFAVCTGLIIR